MDWNLTTAVAAAAISGAGAGIAIWQARIAKRQAATADAAAVLAARQAVAAEQQVKAAEEQVALMRRQLDAEDAERVEARGPQFEIKHRGATHGAPNQWRVTRFEFTQTTGPALATITVAASGNGVLGVWTDGDDLAPSTQVGPVAAKGTFTVDVAVERSIMTQIPVTFTLDCSAQDTPHQWRRSQADSVRAYARVSSVTRSR
ncbi:hypothetical protein [Streptomyces sp. NRRL B-24484]|uniref:hypothetical protein n=1 Tax=Streptomyces sp. NRRL B-24484 TaxID=1463833 RepID=UPI0013316DDF|nr:hypothetical protein [Streptomyces sp. NRRL B-24484]